MSADRINSKGVVVLQSEVFDTNTASGNGTTRTYTGSKVQMTAQRQVEIGFGATVTKLESTGDGNYRLTASYTWDASLGSAVTPPVNTHELETDMESVDGLNTDITYAQLIASFGSVAGANGARAFLNARLKRWDDSAQDAGAVTTIEAEFSGTYSGGQLTLMLNLFRGAAYHKLKGTQYNTIYRRRIVAASYNQVQAAFTGAGMIWKTSELLAFENVPSLWWFQLPSTYLWKKTPPRVLTTAQQKTEISYEYIAAATYWSGSNVAYNAATLITF